MRLFLSSQDFGNHLDELVKLVGKNKKVIFINNAKDNIPQNEIDESTAGKKTMFEDAGFLFEAVDLRNYFGKQESLNQKISGVGLVWVSGGNTFILRRAMAASGLDDILKEQLDKDNFVYGGSSAGSCVATVDLHGTEKGDRPSPDIVPKNYPLQKIIWEGLGLVPFAIVPHFKSDWFGDKADAAVAYFEKHKLPYKALRDGEVVVVSGSKTRVLK